jgi:hypothetical protein
MLSNIINMILSNDKYYIIRVGGFATDANTKIYYSLFSLALCSHDYLYNNSTECFVILYYSTLIWTCIEFYLYITATREIKPMHLYYNNTSVLVPRYVGIFLQGFQEGGCISTIGLYFGDRLFILKYTICLHLLILFIMVNVFFRKSTKQKSSIRQVNSKGSLLLMATITLYNLKMLNDNPLHLQRQLQMLFVMIYVSFYWTIAVLFKGFRDVIVHIREKDEYVVKKYDIYDTIYVLAYDVIFEIGMAYLFFYRFLI